MTPEEENKIEGIQSVRVSKLTEEEIELWIKKYMEIWKVVIERSNWRNNVK